MQILIHRTCKNFNGFNLGMIISHFFYNSSIKEKRQSPGDFLGLPFLGGKKMIVILIIVEPFPVIGSNIKLSLFYKLSRKKLYRANFLKMACFFFFVMVNFLDLFYA